MVFDVYLSLGMVSTFMPQVAAISRSWASVVKDNSSVVRLKLKRLDAEAFDTIHYRGQAYDYAMGYPQFIETLHRSFPHEKENLKRYTEQLQAVGNLISVDHLKQGVIALEGMKYFCTSAAGLIADITHDHTLQNVLAGSALLYGEIGRAHV